MWDQKNSTRTGTAEHDRNQTTRQEPDQRRDRPVDRPEEDHETNL